MITKLATSDHFRRSWIEFKNARSGFEHYLKSLNFSKNDTILIPNYIGFSQNEGSGVFDPIKKVGLNYAFYEMDPMLYINVESIRDAISTLPIKLIVIIHYFGYVDPKYHEILALCSQFGITVFEDQAHSLFTDLYGGVTGRFCDASIYSLHKMFPVKEGGALMLNASTQPSILKSLGSLCLNYDIVSISKTRRDNALYLSQLLSPYSNHLTQLRPSLDKGVVPQTFPIRLLHASRDDIYHKLNNKGYGVVSLYHTMIPEISSQQLDHTHQLSTSILNFPIHQDVTKSQLDEMVTVFIQLLNTVSS